jgi:hypothetical protein
MEQVKSDEKAFLPKVILNGLFDKTRCENGLFLTDALVCVFKMRDAFMTFSHS